MEQLQPWPWPCRGKTGHPGQALGVAGAGLVVTRGPGPGVWLCHQTLIIVVINVGRLVAWPSLPPSPTTNLPTGSRQTLNTISRSRSQPESHQNNMQICSKSASQLPTGPDAPPASVDAKMGQFFKPPAWFVLTINRSIFSDRPGRT